MGKSGVAKLFRNGRSQAVRLPREFRFEGDAVRVRRVPEGVLLQPMITDPKEWFAAMDRRRGEPFLKTGRKQPKALKRRIDLMLSLPLQSLDSMAIEHEIKDIGRR